MKASRSNGFTLLELLVAMTLFVVIMVGLVSSLRALAQLDTKIDQRLQRLDEMRASHGFLQSTLSRVSGSVSDAPGAQGKRVVSLIATPNSLEWVGVLPARPNTGGRHFFQLAIAETDTEKKLVIKVAPYSTDATRPDWAVAQTRVLAANVLNLTIQARGIAPDMRDPSEAWPAGWQNGWPIAGALPEQVRITVTDSQGQWSDWIFALQAMPQTDSGYSRVAIGGTR